MLIKCNNIHPKLTYLSNKLTNSSNDNIPHTESIFTSLSFLHITQINFSATALSFLPNVMKSNDVHAEFNVSHSRRSVTPLSQLSSNPSRTLPNSPLTQPTAARRRLLGLTSDTPLLIALIRLILSRPNNYVSFRLLTWFVMRTPCVHPVSARRNWRGRQYLRSHCSAGTLLTSGPGGLVSHFRSLDVKTMGHLRRSVYLLLIQMYLPFVPFVEFRQQLARTLS